MFLLTFIKVIFFKSKQNTLEVVDYIKSEFQQKVGKKNLENYICKIFSKIIELTQIIRA